MNKMILLLIIFIYIGGDHTSASEIVQTDKIYTYELLTDDLHELAKAYPAIIQLNALAETSHGRKIWAVKLGNAKTSVLLNGAHHAREWMTSTLLVKMIETYAKAYQTGTKVAGFHPKILDEVSILFVPMVNPDGVTLQQFGLHTVPLFMHEHYIKMNKHSMNFDRWKANGTGIDLNRQYPAGWEKLKGVRKSPGYKMFKGSYPLQAEEARALASFAAFVQPEIAVSYHSSGEVIFWGMNSWRLTHTTDAQTEIPILTKLSKLTSYKLTKPAPNQEGGGFTDWFSSEFNKPAFTIEIGALVEERSLPLQAFSKVWQRNQGVGLLIAQEALELKKMKENIPPNSKSHQ